MAMAVLMAKSAAAVPLSLSLFIFILISPCAFDIRVLNFQRCALISNCLLIRESRELTMQGEM